MTSRQNAAVENQMDDDYGLFVQKMKGLTGLDLHLYKEAQMKRRLFSFLQKKGFHSFTDLFDRGLQKDEVLLKEILDRMTINVSEFFRNPARWEVLQTSILPGILNKRSDPHIWSAACSTGEEPYSLWMMMKEAFPGSSFSITATDIDSRILEQAQMGLYSARAVENVPPAYRQKYFEASPPAYQFDTKAAARDIRFKKQNLLADNPVREVDVIICRNVMIYFTEEAKDYIYQQFYGALRPGGVLFVGSTEQMFHPEKYKFEPAGTFFYRKS
ncbi:protein-glutamate O-methyltransferase CheR [Marinococcus sp. PL1-022]|uniref:CheR family methyltransferase n=1 Tax=Marinococcus sp. PL1-022 TaxID=3095363 RepID=UPI0029C2EAB7|nr:protein-glutamate O-methyltransferase CheR [Marinococcus sp. PL1-022]MDX6152999.1 protein-glutamate O-methyltransferase CheR [Marinococcus sp. PL1-022]